MCFWMERNGVRRFLSGNSSRFRCIHNRFDWFVAMSTTLTSSKPACGIVYLHGFASGPSSTKARLFSEQGDRFGWPTVVPRLDRGDFEKLTISNMIDDVVDLLFDRTLLVGSSLGGYVASLVAARDERVKAMLLMAPAFDFADHLASKFGPETLAAWKATGSAPIIHHEQNAMARLGYQFYEDAERHIGRPNLDVPTTILLGEHDDVVSADAVLSVARNSAARHPDGRIHLIMVPDDHRLIEATPKALDAAARLARRHVFLSEPEV